MKPEQQNRLPEVKKLVELYRQATKNKRTLQAQMAESAVMKIGHAEAAAAQAAIFARLAGEMG